jgi:hypothetical protein
MTALPFLQAPAKASTRVVGNEASGTLQVPVLGGLTVAESAAIQELLSGDQSTFVKAAQIADAIAKAEGVTLVEAFELVEAAVAGRDLEPEAMAMKLRHAARMEEMGQVLRSAGERTRQATVTALIRHRLGMPEWSMADTQGLHRRLFDELYRLAEDETVTEDLPSKPRSEEELGKPPAGGGSPKRGTGKRSSGA